MSKLARFGVSIDENLLKKFDSLIHKQKYPTRSKAIENLIRQSIETVDTGDDTSISIGYIDMIYDHHKRQLLNNITEIQHKFHDIIVSSQHVHISHSTCLELVVVKGIKSQIAQLSYMLKSTKGIEHSTCQIFKSK